MCRQDFEDFLRRLGAIRIQRSGDERAPHKPLLLLLALGRVQRGERRLASYGDEVECALSKLLRRFGPPRSVQHPEAPFARLRGDDLWEVVADADLDKVKGKGGITSKQLRDHRAAGGFPEADHLMLLDHPSLIDAAAQKLLVRHFPLTLHDAIRDEVGLAGPRNSWFAEETSTMQAPTFREAVLRAYERRCAICGFDVRLDDNLVGLNAAHIHWQACGGSDEVNNGIALCILHHVTFDQGVIGLIPKGSDPENTGFRVVVSDQVNGQSSAFRQLVDCHGKPLRRPQSDRQEPAPDFVDWHRREVFKGSPRDLGNSSCESSP